MGDFTEMRYTIAYIRGTKMYTRKTQTCHVTTIKQ